MEDDTDFQDYFNFLSISDEKDIDEVVSEVMNVSIETNQHHHCDSSPKSDHYYDSTKILFGK
jgi:hypothetical protein